MLTRGNHAMRLEPVILVLVQLECVPVRGTPHIDRNDDDDDAVY